MINNINTNQEVFYQQNAYNGYQHHGVIDSGGNFAVSDYEREREVEKQRKRDRLSKLKCSRGESWVWNPRQFYCQIMCPVCERGSRELTVLHFRNHLELQHTAEEVENVKVCKLCHRSAVQNRQDIFDGLILDLDPQAKINHMEQKHQNYQHECEFMGIYEKHKRTMGDNWGLEGIERDSTKVYKYAKENFSRAKRNERSVDGTGSELSSIGGSCASITPEPPIPSYSNSGPSYSQNQKNNHEQSMGKENSSINYYDPTWNQPNTGFSYRSLLQDLNDEEDFAQNESSGANADDFQNSFKIESGDLSDDSKSQAVKRPSSNVSNDDSKNRRLDRCADPELRKLRCGIGGSYRFSMSKLHFSKVSCPYCLLPSEGETTGKVFIKAEYWRRHVTEVHNKAEEIEETKKLVLCLECYNMTLSKRGKGSDGSNSPLPEFDGLYRNREEQIKHVKEFHNGNEVEFISVWDKKEAAGASRSSRNSTNPSQVNYANQMPIKHEVRPQTLHQNIQNQEQYAANIQQYPTHGYNPLYNSMNQNYHPYHYSQQTVPYQNISQSPQICNNANQVQSFTCQIASQPMQNHNIQYNDNFYSQYQPQQSENNIVFAHEF